MSVSFWRSPSDPLPYFEKETLNLSNPNAMALLRLLGLDDQNPHGVLPTDGIPRARQRIVLALNDPSIRASEVEEPSTLEGGHAGTAVLHDDDGTPRIQRMGARAYLGGRSDEYLVRQLHCFDELLRGAQESGHDIFWG